MTFSSVLCDVHTLSVYQNMLIVTINILIEIHTLILDVCMKIWVLAPSADLHFKVLRFYCLFTFKYFRSILKLLDQALYLI